MVMDSRSGQMALNTKEIGRVIKLMDMVNSSMLMEISMRDSGKMIKLMAMEIIHMLTEQLIVVNGKTISNMVKVQKPGQMVPNMRVSISKVKSTIRVP